MNILAFWLMLCYAVSVIAQSDQLERNSTVTTENHPTETIRSAPPLQNVNTVPQFPGYSRRDWEKVAQNLRTHILVSTGQYPYFAPMAKAPLNAQVFDRIEREDYTVEKTYFESYPGFFCTGAKTKAVQRNHSGSAEKMNISARMAGMVFSHRCKKPQRCKKPFGLSQSRGGSARQWNPISLRIP